MGLIELSQSEWAFPIFFAPKKDVSLRFCIYYRRLNAITILDSDPIPKKDYCVYLLRNTQIFSTLDANNGYFKILIEPHDRDKKSFTSKHGFHRFIHMLFGLKNAPATFQRSMDFMPASLKYQLSLVYLDDFFIIFNNLVERI